MYRFFVTAAAKVEIPHFINTYVHVSNLTYDVQSIDTVDRRREGFGPETVDLVSPTFENKERREGREKLFIPSSSSRRAAAAAAAADSHSITLFIVLYSLHWNIKHHRHDRNSVIRGHEAVTENIS